MRISKKFCFSLVELLVVVTVLMMLFSLLTPSLKTAVDQARQLECMHKLQKISHANHMYADDSAEEVFIPLL